MRVPINGAVGKDDKDYSNVGFAAMDLEGKPIDWEPKCYIVPSGTLGTLKGGLLHMSDHRSALNKDDVVGVAVESTKQCVEKKRTELRPTFAFIFCERQKFE